MMTSQDLTFVRDVALPYVDLDLKDYPFLACPHCSEWQPRIMLDEFDRVIVREHHGFDCPSQFTSNALPDLSEARIGE